MKTILCINLLTIFVFVGVGCSSAEKVSQPEARQINSVGKKGNGDIDSSDDKEKFSVAKDCDKTVNKAVTDAYMCLYGGLCQLDAPTQKVLTQYFAALANDGSKDPKDHLTCNQYKIAMQSILSVANAPAVQQKPK